MKNSQIISVIIPVYNGRDHLACCLTALTQQSVPLDEIIVVDDGSKDQYDSIVRGYPIILLRQPHRGPAAARNLGARSARGDIILFTDVDCEPTPNWVAEMIQPFSDSLVMGVKGSYKTRQTESVARLMQIEFEERYDRLESREQIDFVDTYSAAFRSGALHQIGDFDEALPYANNEDVDLSFRMARAGYKLVFNRHAVVFHQHINNWMRYIRLKFTRGYWRTIIYRLHPAKAVSDSYTPQTLKLQIVSLYLGFLFLILAVFLPLRPWIYVLPFLVMLIAAGPFLIRVYKKDRRLILWAVYAVIVRALAFGDGIIAGLVGGLMFKPNIDRGKAVKI